MCPACIATAALFFAGTTSTGGLLALFVKKWPTKKTTVKKTDTPNPSIGGRNESSENRDER